jgi:restriction system protein
MLHVVTDDRSASKGIIVTTSDFAPGIQDDPAIKPYLPYRLELLNGEALMRKLEGLAGKSHTGSNLA